MSMFDSLLSQVSDTATVQTLAAKVGLSSGQVEAAIAALGESHLAPGDTTFVASQKTGLAEDKLQQIVSQLGGTEALGRFATILEAEGGAKGLLGGLKKFL